MQNNFHGQNIIVNQRSGHLLSQNNILPQNNQLEHHNNMSESQQVPVQASSQQHTQNSVANKSMQNSTDALQVVTKQRLQDLVHEIDQTLTLEEEVEETLLSYVDEFVDRCLNGAVMIAKNRHCSSIEVKDVQQFINRNYNMWTPGFGTDELRPYKRSLTTEAHKQRMALIRKSLKKY